MKPLIVAVKPLIVAVKPLIVLVALALAGPVAAQDRKPARRTGANPVAHAKPTPQQIRRFRELEKEEQRKEKKKK